MTNNIDEDIERLANEDMTRTSTYMHVQDFPQTLDDDEEPLYMPPCQPNKKSPAGSLTPPLSFKPYRGEFNDDSGSEYSEPQTALPSQDAQTLPLLLSAPTSGHETPRMQRPTSGNETPRMHTVRLPKMLL